MSTSLPTPAELGAPSQYDAWRENQEAAFAAMLASDKFAIALNLPTGSGKSLLAVCWKLISSLNVVVLTKTNALLDQYMRLFREIGMREVRGMGARRLDGSPFYVCDAITQDVDRLRLWRMTARTPAPSVEEGPCHDGWQCPIRETECGYYKAIRTAGSLTVTNYAFWLANQNYGRDKIGPYDLLICDEAHEAADELASFLSDEMTTWEVENLIGYRWPKIGNDKLKEWATWGKMLDDKIEKRLEPSADGAPKGRERKSLRLLQKRAKTVARVGDTEAQWVITDTTRGKMFQPVWASPYRKTLFGNVKQVAFMSGSVGRKDVELNGLKPEEYDFHEFPSSFPVERRPIIRVPTCQVTSRTSLDTLAYRWVPTIDAIIRLRPDRKGIVHTVSYRLAEFLYERSEQRARMITHGRGEAAQAIARFKAAPPGAVLISPVVGQGYDFPGRELEFQIIGKLAFPDTRDPIMEIRCNQDPEYRAHLVMKALVQAAGRGNRSAEDFCETLIVDDMAQWFFRDWGYLAPLHFGEAYQEVATVPLPPEGVRAL